MQIEIPAQAGQVLAIVKPLFGGSLLGFYLYGSATYGGLHPDSDVDLLAVLDRPMTDTERKSLTAALLRPRRLCGQAPARGHRGRPRRRFRLPTGLRVHVRRVAARCDGDRKSVV